MRAGNNRFCAECVHYIEGRWPRTESLCGRTEFFHIVTGEKLHNYCEDERTGNVTTCGINGVYWERKKG